MAAFPNYATGTVAVANGATVVIGTGTLWTDVNARSGDTLLIDGHLVIVEDVTDATHIVIDAWPYTTVAAGASYKIIQNSPLRFNGSRSSVDVTAMLAALEKSPIFVAPGLSVPDPTYGNEGQYAWQPTTFKYWKCVSGLWVYQGSLQGLLSANNLSDLLDMGEASRNLGGFKLNAFVGITGNTTMTDDNLGRVNYVYGADATITIPSPAGKLGARLLIVTHIPAQATGVYTIVTPDGTRIGRTTSLKMVCLERFEAWSDGLNWLLYTVVQNPLTGRFIKSVDQTLTAATPTAISFTSTDNDPTGLNLSWDATNHRFKAIRAGTYKFTPGMYVSGGSGYVQMWMAKNGSQVTQVSQYDGGSVSNATLSSTFKMVMAAGDYAELVINANGSPNVSAGSILPSYMDYEELVPSW